MPVDSGFEFVRIPVPIANEFVDEFLQLWEPTFEAPYEEFRAIATGDEISQNQHIVYVARIDDKLAATSGLTIDRSGSGLGGLGEVATAHEFRGNGLATTLCELARDEFRRQGGRALFLGTGNPAARRIYRRLGWRPLPGAEVMVCLTTEESPEDFLVDHFRTKSHWSISTSTATMRLSIIPLCCVPHDWQVLDANTRLYSTRYAVQKSCMGLFPRYQELIQSDNANCFVAWTDDGKLVGLSSAKIDEDDNAQIDGFAHCDFEVANVELLQHAIDWSDQHGAVRCHAVVSIEDHQKRELFQSLGFDGDERADDIDFDGLKVRSRKLIRTSTNRPGSYPFPEP